MNYYLIFILFFLTFTFLLDSLADLLNLGRLKETLPEEFAELKDVFDEKKYSDALKYQRVGVRFDLVRRTFSFGITLAFILVGGFNWIDQFSRSMGKSELITGLIFVAVLSLLKFISQLPFSIYDTFVIEESFGFNKTTASTFILDIIKGMVLGAILGGLVFSGVVYFFENGGPNAWLISWGVFTLFQIVLMYIAPAVIMPLFNKFSSLPEGPLRTAIEDYARKRNFKLSGIFTMDNSKRSTKANAFFTGFGNFRRLVLFDTLIEKQTIPELVAVLAHEIGHFERKHIIKSLLLSILTTGLVFFTFHVFMNNPELFQAFKMESLSTYASVVFVGFLYSPILRILSLFTQHLSRKHEYEADEFAVKTYGRAEDLISALKKLSADNLSHLTPHPLKVALDYTHPPLLQRIKAMRQIKV
jgi:STE24 endopeptidase